jgi:hypothetical protein
MPNAFSPSRRSHRIVAQHVDMHEPLMHRALHFEARARVSPREVPIANAAEDVDGVGERRLENGAHVELSPGLGLHVFVAQPM